MQPATHTNDHQHPKSNKNKGKNVKLETSNENEETAKVKTVEAKLETEPKKERKILADLSAILAQEKDLREQLAQLEAIKEEREVSDKQEIIDQVTHLIEGYNAKARLQIEAMDLAHCLTFGRPKGTGPAAKHEKFTYRDSDPDSPTFGKVWHGNARNPGKRPTWLSKLIKSELLKGNEEEREQAYAPTDALIVRDAPVQDQPDDEDTIIEENTTVDEKTDQPYV